MAGKGCVCIASDNRYGQQLHTISTEFPKIFKITDKIYLGLSGLATDIQTTLAKIKFRLNMYKLREGREMTPQVFEPVIAAINDDGTTSLCGMDCLGAAESPKD